MLLNAGANANDQDAWGVSATVLAVHSGFRDLAALLLDKGADPNKAEAGFTALHEAIMRRDEKMVAALLAHGADPNAPLKAWTPTRRSSRDFHFEPALIGATPFWLAARFDQPAVMRLLVEKGADPLYIHRADYLADRYKRRKETATAVMAALGMGGGTTAWVQAPRKEREVQTLEAVKFAIELGVNVNTANTDGRTALDAAKALHYDTVVKFLAEKGAQPGNPTKPAKTETEPAQPN
jgi:ankyrin repeat protein